jgi:hypothetical protein
VIKFPESAAFGKKIPLAQLKEKGVSPKFLKSVKSVKWAYKLSQSTLNLAATGDVKEIEVLEVVLRSEGESLRNRALAIEVLGAMIPNPCLFRLFNEDGDFIEEAICPKASGGALLGDSPIYRLCRGFGETDELIASGVTTLEAALVRWSAALAGMGVRAGEGVRAFAERHYRLESLRAQSADLEKKIVREKQLDRKYELLKEKRQLEKEVELWIK